MAGEIDNLIKEYRDLVLVGKVTIVDPDNSRLYSSIDISNYQLEEKVKQIGEPILKYCMELFQNEDAIVRERSIVGLGRLGQPSIELLKLAVEDPEVFVRNQAIIELGTVGTPAQSILTAYLNEEDDFELRKNVIMALGMVGASTLDILIELLNDPNFEIRRHILRVARELIGLSALRLHVLATEDTNELVASQALDYLISPSSYKWKGNLIEFMPEDSLKQIELIVLNDLIIRSSKRPEDSFNSTNVAKIVKALIRQNPTLQSKIHRELCDISYRYDSGPRQRAVAVARNLSVEEFAAHVKNRSTENPKAAAQIMRELGGSEATAFFTEAQSQTLAEYRAPLVEFEDIARQRWEELTLEARRSSATSKWMSVGVFIVGTVIVIWAFILLTLSDEPWQQLAAAFAGIGSFLAMYSQRFWKDPVEQIQRFSAQQARLQVSFIGFMNRVAQIRLVFEDAYAKDKLPPETMAMYQKWLEEAADKAWQQLSEASSPPAVPDNK
ncbi:MAG: HEAT repeat domain-containing protein [Anaerolineae bacterium]|nr:HEAT repeat domain-containing protein [Anaerolineae bacterium]